MTEQNIKADFANVKPDLACGQVFLLERRGGAKLALMAAREQDEEWLEGVRDRLSLRMRAKGFSQRALGAEIGVTGAAVNQWLSESNLESWWKLKRLAEVLDVDADWILSGEESPETEASALERRLVRDAERYEALADALRKQASARAKP